MKRRFGPAGMSAARITVPDQDDTAATGEIEFVRWAAQLQADLAASLGGVMLRGALPIAIGSAPGGSTRPLSSPGRVVGWSLLETSGTAAATVTLWDGREAGSRPLAYLHVGAGLADTQWLGGGGISVTDALLIDISGAVAGVLYLGAVD